MEPRNPPSGRCFWHYEARIYYTNFLWNEYCFCVRYPSLCAERKTEAIVSGVKASIPHIFSSPKAMKFGLTCSRAIPDREASHKGTAVIHV